MYILYLSWCVTQGGRWRGCTHSHTLSCARPRCCWPPAGPEGEGAWLPSLHHVLTPAPVDSATETAVKCMIRLEQLAGVLQPSLIPRPFRFSNGLRMTVALGPPPFCAYARAPQLACAIEQLSSHVRTLASFPGHFLRGRKKRKKWPGNEASTYVYAYA